MIILGIETSCDETSAGIVRKKNNKLELLSNVVSSSLSFHAKTGGIIPEIAAREQIKYIIPVIKESLRKIKVEEIDKIAVTYGPGLMGSLLVGVETAKTLSMVWDKPIIPTNHLIGHIYANWIENEGIELPAIGLIVSGGHTDLVLIKNHGNIKWLGGTRDDAAGEAFDKIGRLLGLPYPAGHIIEQLAKKGNAKKFNFPRPMIDSNDFDFSFSGLKTAVLRQIERGVTREEGLPTARMSVFRERALAGGKRTAGPRVNDIAASVQQAIVDVLIKKTLNAAKKFNAKSILLGGGVAANQAIRERFKLEIENWKLKIPFFIPEKRLCTDNGAMIAAAAFYNGSPVQFNKISANPQLYFE